MRCGDFHSLMYGIVARGGLGMKMVVPHPDEPINNPDENGIPVDQFLVCSIESFSCGNAFAVTISLTQIRSMKNSCGWLLSIEKILS